jgi:membrane protein involved in colicin uptake
LKTLQNLTFERKKKKERAFEKLKNKSSFEDFTKLHFSGAKNERQTRERRNRDEMETRGKAEKKQRQNKERTRKRGAFVP